MPAMYEDLESGMTTVGESLNGIFKLLPAGVQEGWHTMMENLEAAAGDIIGKLSEPTVSAAGRFAKGIPSVLVSGKSAIFFCAFFCFFVCCDKIAIIVTRKQMGYCESQIAY